MWNRIYCVKAAWLRRISAQGEARVLVQLGGGTVSHDIEPLETSVWLHQLRELVMTSRQSDEALARSLRRGLYLAQLAPRPLRLVLGIGPSESEFERLLEAEALLPAALALVGDRLNYSLSCLDGGRLAEAQVWFPNERPSTSASGSAASALFQAWLQCLTALDEPADLSQFLAGPPTRRKSQVGLRPRLTEH